MRMLWLLMKANLKSDSFCFNGQSLEHKGSEAYQNYLLGYYQVYLCHERINSHTIHMHESTLLKLCCKKPMYTGSNADDFQIFATRKAQNVI